MLSTNPPTETETQPSPVATRDVVASTGAAAVVTTTRRLLITGLSALATAVLARVFGPGDFGSYSSALAAYALAVAVCDLGFSVLVGRELPRRPADRGRIVRAAVIAATAWGVAVALVVVALALLNDVPLQRDVMLIFVPAILLAGLTAVRPVFVVVFQTRRVALVDIVVNVGTIGLVLGLAVAGAGLRAIAAVVCAGAIVNTVLVAWLARRYVDGARPTTDDVRRVMRAAVPIGVASVLASLYFVIDLPLLGYVADGAPLGQYAAAVKLLMVLVAVPGIIMALTLPGLSAARDDRAALDHFVRRASHWIAAVGLPACVACIVFAGPIVDVLYGPGYEPAKELLRILALAGCLSLLSNVLGTLLLMFGIVGPQIAANVVALAVKVVGIVVLVPSTGVEAAAWLAVGTEVLVVATAAYLLRGRVSLSVVARGAGRPAAAVGVFAACGLALASRPAIAVPVSLAALWLAAVRFGAWPHELSPASIRRQESV